jgi:plasmid stabilization system protein ParE
MDYQIVWSPEAIEDIESISSYISRDSEHYASAVVMKILDVGYEIQHTPFVGRIVPEFDDEVIRERIIYSYRLILSNQRRYNYSRGHNSWQAVA